MCITIITFHVEIFRSRYVYCLAREKFTLTVWLEAKATTDRYDSEMWPQILSSIVVTETEIVNDAYESAFRLFNNPFQSNHKCDIIFYFGIIDNKSFCLNQI